MRFENKSWERKGQYFFNSVEGFDLSAVRVLHTGVDTVKQLFNCLLRRDVLTELQEHSENFPGRSIELGGIEWLLNRSSKQSGYQYILKNLDVGFVVLVKSFYADESLSASHVKIEVTPQCIYESTPEGLTAQLRRVASIFATQLKETGIAAHIAVDLKGWDVPADFEQRLVAKAKRQYRASAISQAQFSLNEIATIYGNGQTYTFGSASGLQLCIYDKVAEATKSDKLSFWEGVWQQTPAVDDVRYSEYVSGDSVRRIEVRFHHSVIQQFCWGSTNTETGETLVITNFLELCDHLTALWQYGLNNFRLQHSSSYIDPVWQLLRDDVTIFPPAPNWEYKRGKKAPGEVSRRNVAFWLGNVMRLMARKRFNADFVVNYILSSGLDDELADYFGVGWFGEHDALRMALYEFVQERLERHTLSGVAA